MKENIQPRILIVDNIYIKDHADNDTHGRYNCCAISRKISVTEIKLIYFSHNKWQSRTQYSSRIRTDQK